MRLENLRRLVVENPPWTVFLFALTIAGFGILCLAFKVKGHPDFEQEHGLRPGRFCIPRQLPSPVAWTPPEANTTVPVSLSASPALLRRLNDSDAGQLLTQLLSGQLGLTGREGAAHNWSAVIQPPTFQDTHCGKEGRCRWSSCLVLAASHASALPQLDEENRCSAQPLQTGRLRPVTPLTTAGQSCDGEELSLALDESVHFFLIPMGHDSQAARLHLLYTSCFLFTSLGLFLVAILCRSSKAVLAHHHKHPPSDIA